MGIEELMNSWGISKDDLVNIIKRNIYTISKVGSCLKANYSILLVDESGKILSFGFTTSPRLVDSIIGPPYIRPNNISEIPSKGIYLHLFGRSEDLFWSIYIDTSNNEIEKVGTPQLICNTHYCPRVSDRSNRYGNCPSVHAEQMAIYLAKNMEKMLEVVLC